MRTLLLPFVLFLALLLFGCTRQPVYPAPALAGREAVIDITQLKPDTPRFFTYRFHDKNISFFVINVDGKIVSFFDACASCYKHRQGYRADENGVTCRYCNMTFSIYALEKGLGGCYPIKIEGSIADGKYHIPLAGIEAEAEKF